MYRVNDLVKTDTFWQQAAISKYWSPANEEKPVTGLEAAKARQRSGAIHSETMTSVGRSDAANVGQPTLGK